MSVEPLWLPVNGRQMDLARTLLTNEGNMESVEVSHRQADGMLIVYFALSMSNTGGADPVILLTVTQPGI